MKYLIPVLVGGATMSIAVTTALAGAHGALTGRVPLTPYLYGYGVASLLFGIALVTAIAATRRENPPPELEVRLREIHRTSSYHNGARFDLFLRARIELKSPAKLKIRNYKLELSHYGDIELPDLHDDLGHWEIWNPTPEEPNARLLTLPRSLKRHEPVEGWLHFVTSSAVKTKLDECVVRLVVQMAKGSAYGEHLADPLIWNPRNVKFWNNSSLLWRD